MRSDSRHRSQSERKMHSRLLMVMSTLVLTSACHDASTAPSQMSQPSKPSDGGVHATVVATYKLQSMDGQTLPVTINQPAGDRTITGARYRLFADDTYQFGYEFGGIQQWDWVLPYVRRDSTIEFYLSRERAPQSSFYADVNYLFSTGTLSGGVMSVKYTDPIDFGNEVYVLEQ
jgi:hypothetical protein